MSGSASDEFRARTGALSVHQHPLGRVAYASSQREVHLDAPLTLEAQRRGPRRAVPRLRIMSLATLVRNEDAVARA